MNHLLWSNPFLCKNNFWTVWSGL